MLTGGSRMAMQRTHLHWLEIELQMAWRDEQAKAISRIPGIGPVTASALVATVDNFKQFASGGQFGCWIGPTPSQDSSGGTTRLGRISKRGDTYLRTLLIQAAKSAVRPLGKALLWTLRTTFRCLSRSPSSTSSNEASNSVKMPPRSPGL
jgi:transposase